MTERATQWAMMIKVVSHGTYKGILQGKPVSTQFTIEMCLGHMIGRE